MSDLSNPLRASDFQSHAAFVRRLARRLEASEAAAEDLAQDAWLAAVERPPTQRGSLRAWLASVVRNKATQGLRSSERRRTREELVARDAHSARTEADTAELVERMELHRRVVAAVLELPEAYRSVVVRRFSMDESTADIAAQLELPEPTVRTRLRRGIEKLRTRLTKEMGGTPALFLASLRKLTESHATPIATVDPALTASTTAASATVTAPTLLLVFAMKKVVLLILLAVASVAIVWSVAGGKSALPQPALEGAESVRAPETLEPAPVLKLAAHEPETNPNERSEVERVAQVQEASTEAAPIAIESPTGEIALRIEDVHGNPISQAKLHATQWRPAENPASSIWWGTDEERYFGESGPDGIVRLVYTRRHETSNQGPQTVQSVGFEVTHPEYITHTEHSLDVALKEAVIVLERGSFLIVSGWIESPERKIRAVKAHVSHDVDVDANDWIPLADGRPSCSRIPPGRHKLYLSHQAHDGRIWYSEVVPFELVEGEQRELALELLPPRTMKGRLADEVPRPVTNGQVELNLYSGGGDDLARISRSYHQKIAADGSFAFDDLPPGTGEIIGMCDGWVSERLELTEEPPASGEAAPLMHWQREFELQQLDPAAHEEEPFVVQMVPSAHAEITVLDPDGEPLADARVISWPNVHWSVGYSTIFLNRTWESSTNVQGVARLENMPGEGRTYLGVHTTEGYLMPLRPDGSNRGIMIELAPGETAQETVRMEEP